MSTPKSAQELPTAIHAKAKAEAGYGFFTLYERIIGARHAAAAVHLLDDESNC